MRVKVSYLSILRDATGVKEEELQLAEGATVEDLIQALVEKYGERIKKLLTDSVIEDGIMITLDGALLSRAEMKKEIHEGSEVLIGLPPFGG
ncbi:MAG: MoaD/ThiS family protein [Candidatus Verstraetearchaeota archaeon]|nr:MoaD/ThiS family protein [Candidatus Verstraetearchaeota archaeon]